VIVHCNRSARNQGTKVQQRVRWLAATSVRCLRRSLVPGVIRESDSSCRSADEFVSIFSVNAVSQAVIVGRDRGASHFPQELDVLA